eukprot:GHVT01097028.1.p1 GENE.GHVT01097028.1~~GHVT01097028.1.p1  ORF type:complete len:364 (+),score=56.15 GHVT01097028.1:228-1319(+)
MLTEGSGLLDAFRSVHCQLRALPAVDIKCPMVVLVGAPNVGKSSLVAALSTGKPKVNSYPFTTKGASLGHIYANVQGTDRLVGQVTDTPGVLDRAEHQQTLMEMFTVTCLRHLPAGVVFVLDVTKDPGDRLSSLQAQLNVRNSLRNQFPTRPWLDVISKCDLFDASIIQQLPGLPARLLPVSARQHLNFYELHAHLARMFADLQKVLTRRAEAVAAARAEFRRREAQRKEETEEAFLSRALKAEEIRNEREKEKVKETKRKQQLSDQLWADSEVKNDEFRQSQPKRETKIKTSKNPLGTTPEGRNNRNMRRKSSKTPETRRSKNNGNPTNTARVRRRGQSKSRKKTSGSTKTNTRISSRKSRL